MGLEKRKHPRIPCRFDVAYEFTSWKDVDLSRLDKPYHTESRDISIEGIGLADMEDIGVFLRRNLIRGRKKVKLSFRLREKESPIIVFARLTWVDTNRGIREMSHRGGLKFLDISTLSFRKIRQFIDSSADAEGHSRGSG